MGVVNPAAQIADKARIQSKDKEFPWAAGMAKKKKKKKLNPEISCDPVILAESED